MIFIQSIKQTFLIIIFLIICSFILIKSYSGSWGKFGSATNYSSNNDYVIFNDSYFTEVDIYTSEMLKPLMHLNASELIVDDVNKKNIAFFPFGSVYTKDQRKINYKGIKGVYWKNLNHLLLEENVEVKSETSRLRSREVFYDISKEVIIAKKEVKTFTYDPKTQDKIYIDSEKAKYNINNRELEYNDDVRGIIKRKKKYEESINFTTDKLTMLENESKILLNGSVFIKKQDITAKSRRGEILLGNYNKKLKYFTLFDDIKLIEKVMLGKDSSMTRRGYGEKLEGVISEEIYILTGYPKVYQGKDVIKGNKIILRENNELVEVDDANTNFNVK